jgi:hypothetical protein
MKFPAFNKLTECGLVIGILKGRPGVAELSLLGPAFPFVGTKACSCPAQCARSHTCTQRILYAALFPIPSALYKTSLQGERPKKAPFLPCPCPRPRLSQGLKGLLSTPCGGDLGGAGAGETGSWARPAGPLPTLISCQEGSWA